MLVQLVIAEITTELVFNLDSSLLISILCSKSSSLLVISNIFSLASLNNILSSGLAGPAIDGLTSDISNSISSL